VPRTDLGGSGSPVFRRGGQRRPDGRHIDGSYSRVDFGAAARSEHTVLGRGWRCADPRSADA
jgi:hypothetical protein